MFKKDFKKELTKKELAQKISKNDVIQSFYSYNAKLDMLRMSCFNLIQTLQYVEKVETLTRQDIYLLDRDIYDLQEMINNIVKKMNIKFSDIIKDVKDYEKKES